MENNNEPKIENNVESTPVVEEQTPTSIPQQQPFNRPPVNGQSINNVEKTKLDSKTKMIIRIIIGVLVASIVLAIILFLLRINEPTIIPEYDKNQFVYGGNCDVYIDLNHDGSTNINEGLYTSYNSLPPRIQENTTSSDYDFENYYYYLFKINQGDEMKNIAPISRKDVGNVAYVSVGYNLHEEGCSTARFNSLKYVCYLAKTSKTNPISSVSITSTKEMNHRACSPFTPQAWKPIIYIYPDKAMDVSIKLGNSHLITTSYPKYVNGWNVKASPNGNLEYNGKNYYALYWEGKDYNAYESNEGFIVKGEDTSKFLEEKLSILGLNEKEANEFIIYWLPKMEHNKYNYIRFDTLDNINNYMPIDIEPKPETLVRVYMMYKPLDNYKDIKTQELTKVERKGYTVVEWGGSEIK